MAMFLENFVVVRSIYPRITERAPSRMAVSLPADATERDYRDLLSEANLNYFHREYSIALQNYLALRHLILTQSHPEMPSTPGLGFVWEIDPALVDLDRIMELARCMAGVEGRYPIDPNPIMDLGDVEPNPAFDSVREIGIHRVEVSRPGGTLDRARDLVAAGKIEAAIGLYERAETEAMREGDIDAAARVANENGAMLATYASGRNRVEALNKADTVLKRAEDLFTRAGNPQALEAVRTNRLNLKRELEPNVDVIRRGGLVPGVPLSTGDRLSRIVPGVAVQPEAGRVFLIGDAGAWRTVADVIDRVVNESVSQRTLGLMTDTGVHGISLDAARFNQELRESVYEPRVEAIGLGGLVFNEILATNFVAYFVHLYFFVLPIAIGDTYLAQGRYSKALAEYRSVLAYPFLNIGIEARYVWLKMANAYLQWGNNLYRRGHVASARSKYDKIIGLDFSVPIASELYSHAKFSALRTAVGEVAKELRGEPHAATNPRVGQVIAQTMMRLRYLSQGFNFFGISDDLAPVFRFKYLQSVATYMADSAIEAERTFVSFRSTAENQKMDAMQLQSALDVNEAALAVEEKRLEDAALEVESARRTREYAQTRKDNIDDALDEWNTEGRELTSMNTALSWASNAANDQDIKVRGVRYDGGTHDFRGDVEDFYEVVGQKRDWLDWEMQRNRITRQQAEIAAEIAMADVRVAQAQVRQEVQALNVIAQQKRVEAAQELVDYAEDRMFDEDLWFQMAAELRDLASNYLDSAIYAAFLMERAYDLEFDRRLNRIRTDYGIGGPAGLLGGDHLKRDILSFTQDYLEQAQKKNPVRLALSLREEFPSGFATFVETGILPFRTDLEIFDRRYRGTFHRKIKRIELFVEGLVPLEGASGFLSNNGITSDWRLIGGAWQKHTRVTPVERMVLSSYQFRRDLAVFQPSDELLGLFENLAPQCEWTLEVPRSGNNVDYTAISDIKFILYFDADHSGALASHLAATLPATGARSTVLSSRFHYPDEYFRLDAENSVDFPVTNNDFAYHYESPTLTAFGVRLVPSPGTDVSGVTLTITRLSDDGAISANTDAKGVISSDAGPTFAAWIGGSAVDSWRVSIDNESDVAKIIDVQLFFTYAFNYRTDGTLS